MNPYPQGTEQSSPVIPARTVTSGTVSGGMVTIQKATAADFEHVYPLLLEFGISRISKEDWRKIFTPPWIDVEPYCGYMLLQDGEVKGYLGLIFSTREIRGRTVRFSNMTSWIVKDEFRTHSLKLLLELLKLKGYTLTNFTPSSVVALILTKVGFAEMQMHQRLLFPTPVFKFRRSKYTCEYDPQVIRRQLCAADAQICEDHAGVDCQHVLISTGSEYCYLVLKKKVYRRATFAKVHYLSHPRRFAEWVEESLTKLCWRLRVAGLMVDERYLNGRLPKFSLRVPQECAAFFKSDSVAAHEVDTLYTELILLHG